MEQAALKRLALQVLGDQVAAAIFSLASLVKGHNAGMLQLRNTTRLAATR